MKISALIACCYSISFIPAIAQVSTLPNEEIKVDLVDPTSLFPGNYYIREGSRIHFRIDNINRNLFNITVNNSTVSLFSEVPPIFKLLTEFDASKLTDDAFKASDDPADESVEAAALIDNLKDLPYLSKEENEQRKNYFTAREELRTKIALFIALYDDAKSLNSYYKNLSNLSQDDCRKFDEIDAEKLTITKKVISDIWEETVSDQDVRSTLFQKSTELFVDIEEVYENITVLNISFKENRDLYKKILSENINSLALKIKTEKNVENAKSQKKNTLELNLELDRESAVSNIFSELLKKIETSYGQIESLEKENFSFNMKKYYDKINRGNFTYISPSFIAAKDILNTSIKIDPKQGLTCSNNYERLNTDLAGTVTGFKMNFSTGLFLLWGKKLFDKSYVSVPIDGDTNNNKIVENKGREKFAPAVGALMHFYNKRASAFSWGGNFGLSVNNETKLNYHLGLSALFGNQQRVILSIGLTLARVKLLSTAYEIDGKIPKSVTTIPTDNFYRVGSFISLTYNLSK